MAKTGPEGRLITAIRKAVRTTPKYRDVLIVKYHGSEFSEAGVSDLLCCVAGVFVAVEVKAPNGRHPVTVKQRAFGGRVLTAGGAFGVVRSVEEFTDILDIVLEARDEADREAEARSLDFSWGDDPDPSSFL